VSRGVLVGFDTIVPPANDHPVIYHNSADWGLPERSRLCGQLQGLEHICLIVTGYFLPANAHVILPPAGRDYVVSLLCLRQKTLYHRMLLLKVKVFYKTILTTRHLYVIRILGTEKQPYPFPPGFAGHFFACGICSNRR
jgi:hypothetical protein